MSDWLNTLRKACDSASQRIVARKLGYSPTVVNLVLKQRYTGDIDAVKRAVLTRLEKKHIPCPIYGEITPEVCSSHQARPFCATSSIRVKLFKACKNCQFNTRKKGA
ncbi:MAG: transcriptional regulator [Rickettsiales bacterium]|nr:transcriptional regulator [Rickettsiales bacterium]